MSTGAVPMSLAILRAERDAAAAHCDTCKGVLEDAQRRHNEAAHKIATACVMTFVVNKRARSVGYTSADAEDLVAWKDAGRMVEVARTEHAKARIVLAHATAACEQALAADEHTEQIRLKARANYERFMSQPVAALAMVPKVAQVTRVRAW